MEVAELSGHNAGTALAGGALVSPFTVPAATAAAQTDTDPGGAGVRTIVLADDTAMLTHFEELSRAFKAEVEVLVGQEKQTAREDIGRVMERGEALQVELTELRGDVGTAIGAIRRFVSEHQGERSLERIFGEDGGSVLPTLPAIINNFLEVNGEAVRPEVDQAQCEIQELKARAEAREEELARLRAELAEARALKTQEERELAEFQALREKESQVQNCRIEVQQLESQLEEIRAENKQLDTRSSQHDAVLREKSDKIIQLVRQLEEHYERARQ